MNIIFTRPLIDSEDLMMNFFSSGHKVIHMPTLSIASANMKPINTKDYDGLIFTSANAVRFLKLKNDDKNIKCFCVGNLTERTLRLKGFNNTVAASGTEERPAGQPRRVVHGALTGTNKINQAQRSGPRTFKRPGPGLSFGSRRGRHGRGAVRGPPDAPAGPYVRLPKRGYHR